MKNVRFFLRVLLLPIVFSHIAVSCLEVSSPDKPPDTTQKVLQVLHGKASYYADKFHGRKTASGEIYNKHKMTAAHKKLPFGSLVRVINKNNGKSIQLIVNDRGPFVKGRIIDLSRAAAEKISMVRAGVVPVRVEVLRMGY